MQRLTPLVVALALATVFATSLAAAHGFLERSEPRANSTVRSPPAQVRIWFTSAVEPAYSRAQVLDAAGKAVGGGDSQVDAASRRLLTVSVPAALAPGRYKVLWRVLAIDGHVTEGEFTFRVAR